MNKQKDPENEQAFIELLATQWPDLPKLLKSRPLVTWAKSFAEDAFVRKLDHQLPVCIALRRELLSLDKTGCFSWVKVKK